jgi:hypothetical protein
MKLQHIQQALGLPKVNWTMNPVQLLQNLYGTLFTEWKPEGRSGALYPEFHSYAAEQGHTMSDKAWKHRKHIMRIAKLSRRRNRG